MLTVSSWDFTMENYGAVWAFMVQLGLLLLFLVLGNIIRRTIPLFRKLLIPSALLGGTLLLITNIILLGFAGVFVPFAFFTGKYLFFLLLVRLLMNLSHMEMLLKI